MAALLDHGTGPTLASFAGGDQPERTTTAGHPSAPRRGAPVKISLRPRATKEWVSSVTLRNRHLVKATGGRWYVRDVEDRNVAVGLPFFVGRFLRGPVHGQCQTSVARLR
jgi:hypothetical protein